MRIKVREDIAAPAAHVFAAVTDTAAFERQALRRGADVRRLDRLPALGPGVGWRVGFPFRGRQRELDIEVMQLEAPVAASGRFGIGGIGGQATADLLALSRGTTRLTITLDLKASTLAARLLLQSLRLARGNLERRMQARVAAWARGVEGRRGGPVQGRPGGGPGGMGGGGMAGRGLP